MEKRVIRQRLHELRSAMKSYGADYYIVPTADFHNSEYVSGYFKVREFLSGFTGSNGTLVVSAEDAGLWTDGRYFVQAQKELEDTGIRLFRMQEEGVPDIPTYLKQTMWEGQCLAFDGRTVTAAFGRKLEGALSGMDIRILYEKDLADGIWQDRPPFPCSRAEIVPPSYCGQSVSEKLAHIRELLAKEQADCFFLSKLDDLMWLFNIRGADIPCNPVLMCYGFVTRKDASIFIQGGALQDEVIQCMREAGVTIRDYFKVVPFLQGYFAKGNAGTLLYDEKNVSYYMDRLFRAYGSCKEKQNLTELPKAIKTKEELAYIRKIYLKDSLAVTKFIYWLKTTVKKELEEGKRLTEYDAALYLDNLRRAIPEFLELSFPTISAYGENAAMMHYEADEKHAAALKAEGMLLVDSGGQYLGGTTDVTRTIVLGSLSEKTKQHYTAVAAGMLRLLNAQFLYGCSGRNLDILAREALWKLGMDYKCGTGHGVGYMLNVHEGPHSIRWRFLEGAEEPALEEGMLVTDEPGVYLEGSYGIRIENVLEVQKAVKNGDGQFMKFETLTFAPIDLDAIVPELLPQAEREALNAYHQKVYEKLSPYLGEEEKEWLLQATRAI